MVEIAEEIALYVNTTKSIQITCTGFEFIMDVFCAGSLSESDPCIICPVIYPYPVGACRHLPCDLCARSGIAQTGYLGYGNISYLLTFCIIAGIGASVLVDAADSICILGA